MVYGACKELASIIEQGVASGELRRVDPRHLFLAMIGACSFPMAERALFEELMGEEPTRKQLDAYAEFVTEIFLNGLCLARANASVSRSGCSRAPILEDSFLGKYPHREADQVATRGEHRMARRLDRHFGAPAGRHCRAIRRTRCRRSNIRTITRPRRAWPTTWACASTNCPTANIARPSDAHQYSQRYAS